MTIEEIVNSTKTIAIIGLSSNPGRTSNRIGKYLLKEDFNIIPVNPNEESVLDKKSYSQISDIPENVTVDMINIFRNRRYTADMVDEIVEWSKSTGQKPVIWTQIGVSSDKAKKTAEENGFIYVENRCLMVEHSKFA